jgi:hypothetical protein
MSFYQYKCHECEADFELRIGFFEGNYILYLYPSEEEEKVLWDAGKDPRDSIVEIKLKEVPQSPVCTYCGSDNTSKYLPNFNGAVKGLGVHAFRRERELYEKGLNKQQAETFYKESMEASKERIATMGEVYKKVDFDMPLLAQKGLAKKTANVTKKLDNLKKANVELSKPLKKKK